MNWTTTKPQIVETLELALRRLLQLGAEDEPDDPQQRIGPCPACEAIRKLLKQLKTTERLGAK